MAYLSRKEREAQIIEGATHFFSEHGLSAQTRELSASLGIAQPLLYRYFPSKQALIERIFDEAFLNRWDKTWKDMVSDESVPLDDRLRAFYRGFSSLILTREWVRLFFYSELEGHHYSRKVLKKLQSDIFIPLCKSLRLQFGYPPASEVPISPTEIDLMLELHGLVLYKMIRRHVYEAKISETLEETLDHFILALHTIAPRVLQTVFPEPPKARRSPAKKR
jgi:AcrR family transcriptional regulator